MISPIILLLIFIGCTVAGYFIIRTVPSLLHTPLMSGMNALSGVTIVGSITATAFALLNIDLGAGSKIFSQIMGGVAIILASINVFGGFGITHRMLKMFNRNKSQK